MRNRILVTAVMMVAIGGGCAESVANAPECERWIADYRQKLAQSHPVQVVEKQNGRVKRYVHRQIAVLTHKPTLTRTASPRDPLRPGLSPQQMVKRFQVMCGDLPPVQTAQVMPPVLPPALPLTPLALPGTPGGPTTPVSTPATPSVPVLAAAPPPSGGGTPPPGGGFTPPSGGGTTPPGGGGTPPPPGDGTPPPPPDQPPGGGGGTPPAPPVPEPSTFALMLAGSMAMAGWAARKRAMRNA